MARKTYLASKLREARKAASLDAESVGGMIGRSGKAVFAWESSISEPSPEMLIALCRIYGVPISFFFPPDLGDGAPTPDERELLSIYRSVTQAGQRAIIANARGVAAEYSKSHQAGAAKAV